MIKEFPFKGGVRRFSNRYHFSGGVPADNTKWTTFSDNVVLYEKAAFTDYVKIVETIGYAPGSDVPVFSKSYNVTGTAALTGDTVPGEVAALVRYSTTARTSKNHPVYLFNYYHGILGSTDSAHADKLLSGAKTALETYAGAWVTGFTDGSVSHHRTGPNGASATGSFVEEYFTHRDFPYTPSA